MGGLFLDPCAYNETPSQELLSLDHVSGRVKSGTEETVGRSMSEVPRVKGHCGALNRGDLGERKGSFYFISIYRL